MPINDIIQVKLFSRLAQTTAVNVRHYYVSAVAPPEPTIVEYGVAVSTQLAPALKNIMVNVAQYHGLVIQKIFPLPMAGAVPINTAFGPGIRPGEELPHQIAGLISLRTTQIGRRRRGRFYTPFASETDSEPPGVPSAVYTTLLGNLGAAIQTTVIVPGGGGGSGNLTPIIWSRLESTGLDIVSHLPRDQWATVRKRSGFNGPDAPPPV